MEKEKIKQTIKDTYGKIASQKDGCGCECGFGPSAEEVSKSLGYSDSELDAVPDANLGLGCGNPTALGEIKEGETVLDLGSGAGIDAFLASKKVGYSGKVIGVDMTPEMIKKANKNAKKYGHTNVEFRLGDIENLPVEDNSIDVIISNCVINLAHDKTKVFSEAYRVLKKDGKMFISDIVLLKELSEEQRNDADLVAACVGGGMLKDDYLKTVSDVGFKYEILSENTGVGDNQFKDVPIESLNLKIYK